MATNLSSNFDRFEMGRYWLTSAGSASGFFSCGVMYAALNNTGTEPSDNDRLNSSVRNGASKSTLLLAHALVACQTCNVCQEVDGQPQ